MAKPIIMPKQGQSVESCIITEWYKKKGDTVSDKNIRSIRPGYGLHPKYYKEVLGKKFMKDVERGEPLEDNMFE